MTVTGEQRKTLQHTQVIFIYLTNVFISVTSHLECHSVALETIQPVLKQIKTRLKLCLARFFFLNCKKYFSTHHKYGIPGLRSCLMVTQS